MNYQNATVKLTGKAEIVNYLPKIGLTNVRQEIMAGLTSDPRRISPKFFYDELGSKLFEEITELEEYYPTRTEKGIIERVAGGLNISFRHLDIVELGSGDAGKISLFLHQLSQDILETIHYYPVDISESAIAKSISELACTFNLKSITGVVSDFYHQLDVIPRNGRRLFLFFGSTIGNFNRTEIREFMELIGREMLSGDQLLIGLDMVKEVDILEEAYNDRKGVTAAFNRNILKVVNNLTGTDFNPDDFNHLAFYNPQERRIEMHLEARLDINISLESNADRIYIKKGETIHTENSHKFSKEDITDMAGWSGLTIENRFSDPKKWFSLVQFSKL